MKKTIKPTILFCISFIIIFFFSTKSYSQKHLEELIQTKWVLVKMKIQPHTFNDSQVIWMDSSQVNLTMDFKKDYVLITQRIRPIDEKYFIMEELINKKHKYYLNKLVSDNFPPDYYLYIYYKRKRNEEYYYLQKLTNNELIIGNAIKNKTTGRYLHYNYYFSNANAITTELNEEDFFGSWEFSFNDTIKFPDIDTLNLIKYDFDTGSSGSHNRSLSLHKNFYHFTDYPYNSYNSMYEKVYIIGYSAIGTDSEGYWYYNNLKNELIFFKDDPDVITRYKITEFSGYKMVLVKVK